MRTDGSDQEAVYNGTISYIPHSTFFNDRTLYFWQDTRGLYTLDISNSGSELDSLYFIYTCGDIEHSKIIVQQQQCKLYYAQSILLCTISYS